MQVLVIGIDRRSGRPLALYRLPCGRDPFAPRRASRHRAFAA